jgi:hypothetical protein
MSAKSTTVLSDATLRSMTESFINNHKGAILTRQQLDTTHLLDTIQKADSSIKSILTADPYTLYIAVEGLIHDRKLDVCDAIGVFQYVVSFLGELRNRTSVVTYDSMTEARSRAIAHCASRYSVPQALLNKIAAAMDRDGVCLDVALDDARECHADLLQWDRWMSEEEESDYSYDSEADH